MMYFIFLDGMEWDDGTVGFSAFDLFLK